MADSPVYPSKVDAWLYPALGLPLLAGPGTVIAGMVSGDVSGIIIGVVVTVFLAGLYALVVWPVSYELGATELIVRFGIVRSRIAYQRIVSVRPSRSWLSAPALSMDRLALDHGSTMSTLISPRDRPRFLEELAAKAGLRKVGEESYEALR